MTISLYPDCREVFAQMLDRDGGRARFHTKAEAIRFRLRCNSFRKLYSAELREAYGKGEAPENPYYRFVLQIESSPEGHDVVFAPEGHSNIAALLFNKPEA